MTPRSCPVCGASLRPSAAVLKARREASGLRADELAELAGMTHSYVYRVELGRVPCSAKLLNAYNQFCP